MHAVVLAGGLGRRMHPLTLDQPKPLLPVGPSTLVEHQVASLAAAGVEHIVLSTGYRHEDFADVVRQCRARGHWLHTVVEDTPQGTGGGLRDALRALPPSDVVIVLNGDLLTGHDLGAQVGALLAAPAQVRATVHVREVEDPERYGSVLIDSGGRITAFVEKSEHPPSRTVNAGTYIVRPDLLELIPTSGVVSLERDVFPVLSARGGLLAHREDAYFLDVGSPAALVAANRDFVLAHTGAPAGRRREALVLPGAHVDPRARLTGGTVVHPGATIGPDAVLESALVLSGASVGAGAEVVRSVVGHRAHVGTGAAVVDCALGSDTRVHDGQRAHEITLPPPG